MHTYSPGGFRKDLSRVKESVVRAYHRETADPYRVYGMTIALTAVAVIPLTLMVLSEDAKYTEQRKINEMMANDQMKNSHIQRIFTDDISDKLALPSELSEQELSARIADITHQKE